jgi:hypothetical protein
VRAAADVAQAPMNTELSRVAELADGLADRLLVALEQGTISKEELRASPDLALVVDAAKLLQAAGAEFPASVVRLAQKAAEQAPAEKGLPEPALGGDRLRGALGMMAERLGIARLSLSLWSWRRGTPSSIPFVTFLQKKRGG